MIRDLVEQLDEPSNLPLIDGERCVHAQVENASCRACVDVCPKQAWIINDESVALDINQCDGCGLCVPVCREDAIKHEYKMQYFSYEDENIAFAACEYADMGKDVASVPCVNSFGLSELLTIYRQGINRLVVCTSDCEQCSRGNCERLTDRKSALNELLSQRGKRTLTLTFVSPSECVELIKRFSPPKSKKISRRNFFRAGSGRFLQYKDEINDIKRGKFQAPGNLLPREKNNDLSIYSPCLNEKQCIGCDACFNVCPHNALQIVDENEQFYYQIEDDNCTGCQLCKDICEHDAISVEQWSGSQQDNVLLSTSCCNACGVSFHVPNENSSKSDLCHICAKHNHAKNLFQVME